MLTCPLSPSKENHVLCEVLEFSGDMWIRLSFFLICALSLVRLRIIRTIRKPGRRVRIRIKPILAAFALFFVIQSLFPICLRHIVRTDVEPCVKKNLWSVTFPDPVVRRLWQIFTIFLQVTVAMLVIIISNSLSIFHLMRDEGRKLSSVEKLAIKWIGTTMNRNQPTVPATNSQAEKTFVTRFRAASVTLLLALVFFSLNIAGVVNTSCKILNIDVQINGSIANSISFLTPAVQCGVYGFKFKGFWLFYRDLYHALVARVRALFVQEGNAHVRVENGIAQVQRCCGAPVHHSGACCGEEDYNSRSFTQ